MASAKVHVSPDRSGVVDFRTLPRVNVLGVQINALDMKRTIDLLDQAIAQGRKGYVCVQGVHGIMEAQRDPSLLRLFNDSLLTTPDGMPLVWIGHSYGFADMDRVYGPDLMLEMCRLSLKRQYTHFLYGGKPGIAERLRESLCDRFPGLRVVGTYSPPFRPLTANERHELKRMVHTARPDLFWVGISTPRQDKFMAEYINELDLGIMLGVGAAFDFHTGMLADSPQWVKRAGLQWLHRLAQEPRRLWKRYLTNIPGFIWRISLQRCGLR